MLASLFFYAWGEPKYILVMLLSIIVNYVFGLLLYASSNKRKLLQKLILFVAVACNLGILFYFKYLNFALGNITRFFGINFAQHNIIMPIGISFFTFQGMSYIIDLYFKKTEASSPLRLLALLAKRMRFKSMAGCTAQHWQKRSEISGILRRRRGLNIAIVHF